MTTKEEARRTIHTFISAERGMRAYVFTRDPAKRERKIAECDAALAALDVLMPQEVDAGQMGLFEEGG